MEIKIKVISSTVVEILYNVKTRNNKITIENLDRSLTRGETEILEKTMEAYSELEISNPGILILLLAENIYNIINEDLDRENIKVMIKTKATVLKWFTGVSSILLLSGMVYLVTGGSIEIMKYLKEAFSISKVALGF